MKISFKADNAAVVKIIKSVNLHQIFNIIEFSKSAKDLESKNIIMTAINQLQTYADSFDNHVENFLETPLPIKRK